MVFRHLKCANAMFISIQLTSNRPATLAVSYDIIVFKMCVTESYLAHNPFSVQTAMPLSEKGSLVHLLEILGTSVISVTSVI